MFLEEAAFIHYNEIVIWALAVAALFLLPRKNVFAQSLALTLLFSFALKAFFQQPRPCIDLPSVVPCPLDFGFPSTHASLAAVAFLGSVGTKWFWVLAPLALFISYSRVLVGVHSLEQVLAGFSLGSVVYLLNLLHVKRK